jgi:hypothetical protein
LKKWLFPIWNKSSDHLRRHFRFYVVAVLLLLVVLGIFVPFTYRGWNRLEAIGLSQLFCSILTLLVISYQLVPALKQLRISEARPKLTLAFDESGRTEKALEVIKGKGKTHHLELWMTNNGDAVAREFQVDLDVNGVFGSGFNPLYVDETKVYDPRQLADTGIRTISFSMTSFPCFVSRPVRVTMLLLQTNADSYDLSPQEFIMPYRIYGTWGQEQGGELRVQLKKIESA